MDEDIFSVKRTNPRFPFSAEAEVTLPDGTSLSSQVFELSSRGCYIDMAKFIPVGTRLSLRITNGPSVCELPARVIYTQPGYGMGVFGMGVVFEDVADDQRLAIESWLPNFPATRPQPSK
jgi:hypothetical protein